MSLARRGDLARAGVAVLVFATTGCFLPVGTGAPQTARTVGHGELGISFHAEAPTVNLEAEEGQTTSSEAVVVAPSASMDLGVSYGLTDNLDVEVDAIGALYLFFLPVPLGGSAGMRARILETASVDMAVASRIGYVGEGEENHADATFLTLTSVVQLPMSDAVRPGLALQAMPTRVHIAPANEPERTFWAYALSATAMIELVIGNVAISPYVAATLFESAEVDVVRVFSGGLSFTAGRNSRRPAPVDLPPPPAAVPPAPAPPPAPPPAPMR